MNLILKTKIQIPKVMKRGFNFLKNKFINTVINITLTWIFEKLN